MTTEQREKMEASTTRHYEFAGRRVTEELRKQIYKFYNEPGFAIWFQHERGRIVLVEKIPLSALRQEAATE